MADDEAIVEYDDDSSAPVPHFYDVAAQRAQAAQYLLVAAENMKDAEGRKLAHQFVDALVKSVDPKAPAVKLVK